MPASGFVKEQHFRVERQRGGDLQGTFATVGEVRRPVIGHVGKADAPEQLHRAGSQPRQTGERQPELHGKPVRPLQRDADIVHQRHVAERGRYLERPGDAKPRHLRRCHPGYVRLADHDRPRARLQELGQEVEHRAFACAIRTDQRVDPTVTDVDVDIRHGLEVPEGLAETPCRQCGTGALRRGAPRNVSHRHEVALPVDERAIALVERPESFVTPEWCAGPCNSPTDPRIRRAS